MTSCPVGVTTISSSMRAALQPSVEGQKVSSAKTMPGLISYWMLKGNQAADDRLLPDRKADAVAILQREAGFFVGEPELFGFRPDCGNLGRGAAGANQFDGGIKILAAAFVGIDHGVRRVADRETAVVAGAVSHVGMQNVVVDGIAGTQNAIREHMRMRIAAFSGNGVYCFHVF